MAPLLENSIAVRVCNKEDHLLKRWCRRGCWNSLLRAIWSKLMLFLSPAVKKKKKQYTNEKKLWQVLYFALQTHEFSILGQRRDPLRTWACVKFWGALREPCTPIHRRTHIQWQPKPTFFAEANSFSWLWKPTISRSFTSNNRLFCANKKVNRYFFLKKSPKLLVISSKASTSMPSSECLSLRSWTQ